MASDPDLRREEARAANAQGNAAMRAGQPAEARRQFEAAVEADPGQPALLLNLAGACRASGDARAAIAALDAALAADPYFVQALFQKAVLLEETGAVRAAAEGFRAFLDTVPPEVAEDPRFAPALAHARAAVAADVGSLGSEIAAIGAAPSRRLAASIAHLTGAAPLYRSEPTFLAVPELPAIPFFERHATPWLGALEAHWESLRDEALTVFNGEGFVPYVANPPGTPLNQWQELDHSQDWGALFLWKHGQHDTGNAARLPLLDGVLAALPLLGIPGRGPNAFLSRLAPQTRIPPHHGVTNARLTVHLPLIVPPGCGFRVGGDTREWVPGEAWVFDDTIEHEAWNDSAEPRLILIFDVWNPLLDKAEQAHLRSVLAVWDRHYGRPPSSAEF